jgi:hypothetical protein
LQGWLGLEEESRGCHQTLSLGHESAHAQLGFELLNVTDFLAQ